MKQHITIQDVATRAGVSKATVSRYLNKKYEYMSEKTKKKIEKVIDELDYRPSKQAQFLKSKKSSLVGLLVADIENLYSAFLIKAIQGVLQEHGYQVIIMNTNNSKEEENKAIQQLLDQNIAGLLIQPVGNELLDTGLYKSMDIPVVLFDRNLKNSPWPLVQTNNYDSTKEMAEEIVKNGYEKIIHVTEKIGTMTVRQERYEAIFTTAKMNGLEVELFEIGNANRTINQLINEEMKHSSSKTALFAANGNALYEVVQAVQKNQLQVPNDVGICGYDDWFWAELIHPGISSIHQEPYKIGERAAIILLRQMDGEQIEDKVEVQASVHIRQSL
jgi:LacI family kdg operon repressor